MAHKTEMKLDAQNIDLEQVRKNQVEITIPNFCNLLWNLDEKADSQTESQPSLIVVVTNKNLKIEHSCIPCGI